MAVVITVQLRGDKELQAALKRPDLISAPVQRFLQRSSFSIEAQAKLNSPVDTGRLRSSINTRISGNLAKVGTNLKYAPHVEYGTRPHFPPLAALQPWARRHGFGAGGAFMVARTIALRGTRATRFFGRAIESNQQNIQRFAQQMSTEIAQAIRRRG